jgi:hypothetical protein
MSRKAFSRSQKDRLYGEIVREGGQQRLIDRMIRNRQLVAEAYERSKATQQ